MSTQRQVQHYLIQWYYFDNNINYLNELQRKKMKTLYKGLKELDPEERNLLAAKYRVEKKPFIKDSVVAESFGMTEKEYRDKRVAIEGKLRRIFKNLAEQEANETEELIPLEVLDEQARVAVHKISTLRGISELEAVKEIVKHYAPLYAIEIGGINNDIETTNSRGN